MLSHIIAVIKLSLPAVDEMIRPCTGRWATTARQESLFWKRGRHANDIIRMQDSGVLQHDSVCRHCSDGTQRNLMTTCSCMVWVVLGVLLEHH
jgi:hypothetical protein